MNENPFNFSKPVRGDNFFNREKEVDTAMGFLKKLQSFSIVGERRIGKTSFLDYILSEDVLKEYNIDPDAYILVYFNMGNLYDINKKIFIEAIVKKIEKQTKIKIKSIDIFEKFSVLVDKLAPNGKNLVIALDEVEIIEPILDVNFSHWLRAIFQRQNAMAITASQKTVGGIDPNSLSSPLFNIFGNLFLGLFEREETENMIKGMFQRGEINLKKDEIDFLADLSGGNPYLIQFLGFHYYEKRINNRVMKSKFRDEMLYHLEDQFNGYWNHLTEKEREFLSKITKSENDRLAYILERKGFLISKEGKMGMFSPLFEKFVETKIQSNDLQPETKVKKEEVKKLEEKKEKFSFAALMAISALFIAILLSISTLMDYISKSIPKTIIIFLIAFIIFFILIVPLLYLLKNRFKCFLKSWLKYFPRRRSK
ncbi:MAG: AAA-like domain-containing protein [Candidatus Methanofastidiosia archaeon]|jgi:hypothetical protein